MKPRGFNTMAMALTAAFGPTLAAIAIPVLANAIKYSLVELDWYGSPGRHWLTEDELGWYGAENGFFVRAKRQDDKVLEVVWAESSQTLDGKKTSYHRPDSSAGWLSPDGEFIGGGYGGHATLCIYVIRKDYYLVEQEGWIHVDAEGQKGVSTFRCCVPEITPAQDTWLRAHGHDMSFDGSRKRKPEDVLKIGGVLIDKAADKAAFERMMALAPKR